MAAAVIRIHSRATGMRTFQPKFISRSYRNLGTVARIQNRTKITTYSLTRNHRRGHSHRTTSNCGPCQPPRNRVTPTAETVIMCMYSARKNMANLMPEYSV
jgi:hypothetical protein